jgi:myosin heavy subunit
MTIICEFCKAEVTTAYSLNRHKKINKKCLSIQFPDKDAHSIENEFLIPCIYCKVNISKYGLPKHMEKCKIRTKIIQELKESASKDSDDDSEHSDDVEDDSEIQINDFEKKYNELKTKYDELVKKNETLEDELKFSQKQYKTYYDSFDEVDDLYMDLKEKHSEMEKELTYYKLISGPNVFIYRQL